MRVDGEPDAALSRLRSGGYAGSDAFAVGSTLTVPVGAGGAVPALAAMTELGIRTEAVTTRRPTLDDVYLQLTGSRLAA